MDDKIPPAQAAHVYVEPAVEAVLAGTAVDPAETSAGAGCKIKYNAKKDE
jgi:hypothetical protein